MQESVYARWEDSDEAGDGLRRRVFALAPREGRVALLPVSERTWERMHVLVDGEPTACRKKPTAVLVLEDGT